jgi:D-alanine-D-alanine ligase-like ATP-grasp enzyme
MKEKEKEDRKLQILSAIGDVDNLREIELNKLKEKLAEENLMIKDIPSDGHCLYR